MRTHNNLHIKENRKRYFYFAVSCGAMNKTHWLELPLSQIYFHSPKCVRAIEVRLYVGRIMFKLYILFL